MEQIDIRIAISRRKLNEALSSLHDVLWCSTMIREVDASFDKVSIALKMIEELCIKLKLITEDSKGNLVETKQVKTILDEEAIKNKKKKFEEAIDILKDIL